MLYEGSSFRSKLVSCLWRSFSTQRCSRQSSGDEELFGGKGNGKSLLPPCARPGAEVALGYPSLPPSSVGWLGKEGPATGGRAESRSGELTA